MNRIVLLVLITFVPLMAADDGWVSLFNGKDLTGWRVNENPGTFTVRDGAIVASGPRSHCFYVGDVANHSFTQFELRVEVMTQPKANGGIYIMTDFQATGWPGAGFEVQVNNSFPGDFRKTGSLYQIEDIKEQLVKDNEWFTEHIIVKGNTITVRVNDKEVVRWVQPADWAGTKEFPERRIRPGSIALQGHDPGSTTYYKNIQIRPLK
ncbi:MAG: DUF1080 domain-containing protein [Acidobacteriales bacterium]|nr:MAG: DUF1080 domain-containing protein [Terriglobales bacterium]